MSDGPVCRVLIVEDHPSFARLMQQMVTLLGHEGIVAHNIAEARAVNPASYDVVLADFSLPDGEATELHKHLRELTEAPILLMSGFSGSDLPLEIEGLFDAVLTKPVDMNDLEKLLQRYCPI